MCSLKKLSIRNKARKSPTFLEAMQRKSPTFLEAMQRKSPTFWDADLVRKSRAFLVLMNRKNNKPSLQKKA